MPLAHSHLASSANPITYGLKSLYIALFTETMTGNGTFIYTYETPVWVPGAISISLNPQSQDSVIYADNVEYWRASINTKYTGSLNIAYPREELMTKILPFDLADSTGEGAKNVLVEYAKPISKPFALLFQFENDARATRHLFYNCYATLSAEESETVNDNGPQPKTTTLNLTCPGRRGDGLIRAKTIANTSEAAYSTWFSQVYQPAA